MKIGMIKYYTILILGFVLASCVHEPVKATGAEPQGHFGVATMDNDSIYLSYPDSIVYSSTPLDSLSCVDKLTGNARKANKKTTIDLSKRK